MKAATSSKLVDTTNPIVVNIMNGGRSAAEPLHRFYPIPTEKMMCFMASSAQRALVLSFAGSAHDFSTGGFSCGPWSSLLTSHQCVAGLRKKYIDPIRLVNNHAPNILNIELVVQIGIISVERFINDLVN